MSNTKEMQEQFVNEFIEVLETKEKFIWEMGWILELHKNLCTQIEYHGYNQLLLMWISNKNKTFTNEWITFKQARKLNMNLKGAKGVTIKYICYFDLENKKFLTFSKYMNEINNGRNKDEFVMKPKWYTIFNTSQVQDYQPTEKTNQQNDISHIEYYLKKNNISIEFSNQTNPCFYPVSKTIYMPNYVQFKNDDEYYATLFHELGHATSDIIDLNYKKELTSKEEKKAYEEIVVEIASVLLCCEFNIKYVSVQNNKAYVQNWLKHLKNKENDYLMKAIKDAYKISSYIMKEKNKK